MGLGIFVLVPLSQYFISVWGWRTTFLILGGLVIIGLLPLNGLLLKHKPEEVGQYVDGFNCEATTPDSVRSGMPIKTDWTLAKALNTVTFWSFMAFSFFATIGVYIILVHSVKYLVDEGFPKMTAASSFAMVGIVSSVLRIVWGWVSDRVGREITYTAGAVCACMGIGALLLLETADGHRLVYLFPLLFGIGWGVTAPIVMSASADLFNGRIFGLIFGIVESVIGLAAAFGAWMAGFIFDRSQSYHWAFVAAIVSITLSCLCLWLAAPRNSRRKR